jgi:hypothetical protein
MAAGEGAARVAESFGFFEPSETQNYTMKAEAASKLRNIFVHVYTEPVLQILRYHTDGWKGDWRVTAGGYNPYRADEPPRTYTIQRVTNATARSLGDVESLTLEEYRDGIRATYRNNSFEEYLRKSAGEKAAIRARFLRRVEGALEAVYDKIRKLPDRAGADNVRDMGLQYLVQKSLEGKVPLDLARKISGFVTSRAPAVAARPAADAEEAEEEAEEEQGGGGRRRRVTRRRKTKGRTRRAVKSLQRRSR